VEAMMKKWMRTLAIIATLTSLGLLSNVTLADAVQIRFDLDEGTLASGDPLDEYRSRAISFPAQTLTYVGSPLRTPFLSLDVDFVDKQTGATQRIELSTLGLGAAANAPSTFGSISEPPGGHNFGPSLIISNSKADIDVFTQARATFFPRRVGGTVAADFDTIAGSVCGHGADNDCDFGVLLPDLVDGPDPVTFSGLSVDVEFGGFSSSITLDTLEFRLISPGLAILQDPPPPGGGTGGGVIPEPSTWLLFATGLGGLLWRQPN
jgi:hypothetical protein